MWREITEADVLGVMNSYETAAYQSAAAGVAQDVLADITARVVDHCRGYIADNAANQVATGLTLPERTIRPALHLIRKDLLTRLDLEVSKDRAEDAKEALRFFERCSEGKVSIERPDGLPLDTSSSVPGMEVVSQSRPSVDREGLDGL